MLQSYLTLLQRCCNIFIVRGKRSREARHTRTQKLINLGRSRRLTKFDITGGWAGQRILGNRRPALEKEMFDAFSPDETDAIEYDLYRLMEYEQRPQSVRCAICNDTATAPQKQLELDGWALTEYEICPKCDTRIQYCNPAEYGTTWRAGQWVARHRYNIHGLAVYEPTRDAAIARLIEAIRTDERRLAA